MNVFVATCVELVFSMDCRAVSVFFRRSLARGSAISSGDGIHIDIGELLPLLNCFAAPSKRARVFAHAFAANVDIMQRFHFDGTFIDAGAVVLALRDCIGVEVLLPEVLEEIGPAEVIGVSDDDADLQIVPVLPDCAIVAAPDFQEPAPERHVVAYAGMSRAELITELETRDDTLRELKRQHLAHIRNARRRKRTHQSLQTISLAPSPLDIVRRGKKRSTSSAVVAVALRRNISNISSEDFGKVIMTDLSRQTVTRCEVIAGNDLLANARLIFNWWHSRLADCESGDVHVFGISWIDDATNSGVWQRRKLHTLKLRSMYFSSGGDVHI